MRRLLLLISLLFLGLVCRAQIVNRLHVDQDIFLRYAQGRMQEFNPDNLALADSLYQLGVQQNNFRYKCLGLSLEMPVRFVLGEYERMDATAAEIKELLAGRKDLREFYFSTLHEYCEFLVQSNRVSKAVLEARAMERLASAEQKPAGKMYAYRIIGLIHSYRDNPSLAIRNLEKAVQFSREARAEQDLPNLYILLAQENVNLKQFHEADRYCLLAEEYKSFFPSIQLKALMTRAILYNAEGKQEDFWRCYSQLMEDPRYDVQTDADSRYNLDITYLRSRGLFREALAKADSLGTERARLEQKHGIYASMGNFEQAYGQLAHLLNEKDSVYIKVQNEDLAILDAEMNNAQLREETQRLKAQNQMTILIGFLVMFAIAFLSILVQQWRLRENLDQMKAQNNAMLMARRAYQKALDAKEAENSLKIKILQNRKSNSFKL
ncbi:MAG: hypothetical protein J5519_04575 [Bacteroidales bacterium]|nr:hypothetical protein [Bacteroidales bacterium]